MSEPSPRFWQIFFEVYEALPRQGPGNRASAQRALGLCSDLPEEPAILDLGCGVGGQTLQLAALTRGTILAVDRHEPSILHLRSEVARRDLGARVTARVGDMAQLELPSGEFDLVWSEGALYNIGIAQALEACRKLLRRGGYVAFTDAVWCQDDPPPEVKASFDFDYPDMGRIADVLNTIYQSELSLVGHFPLPPEAWWDDFYTPMESRIAQLRSEYSGDREALEILEELAREPELHRKNSRYYNYEFFVVRRP